MPRFFVLGSLGINAGDDAMNIALVSMLQRQGCSVAVASLRPSFTQRLLGTSVSTVHNSYLRLADWIRQLRQADAVLIGGGTMIQPDPASKIVSGITLKACVFACVARVLGKPVYCIGIGISTVERAVDRFLARCLLRLSARLYVRDADSAERAVKLLGRSMDNIGVMPDLAFGLHVSERAGLGSPLLKTSAGVDGARSGARIPAGAVFVSAVGETHKAAATTLIRTATDEALLAGLPVVLVAMDRRETEELGLYLAFRAGLDPAVQSSVHIYVVEDPRDLLHELNGGAIAIGMRLHFCILSLIAGATPIIVSREEKTESLAKAEGLLCIGVDDPKLAKTISAAVTARISGSATPAAGVNVGDYAMKVQAVVGELARYASI